jgi:hypothetical protein
MGVGVRRRVLPFWAAVGLALVTTAIGSAAADAGTPTPATISSAATAPPARASGAGPTAIAAATDGTVFVGFKSGAIVAYEGGTGAAGKRLKIHTADQRGSVGGIVALDFAPDSSKKIWVLDTNRRVQQFSTSGKLLRGLRLAPCDHPLRPAAGVRGGLDVTADSIYVAHPCQDEVDRFDREQLKLRALAGVASPHGLAAQADPGAPASSRHLYVTDPTTDHVAVLSLRSLHTQDHFDVRGPATDVYVAADGRVFVSVTGDDEVRGERIYVYDTLGAEIANLGRPGLDLGDLRDPIAFDVHALDSSPFSRNLFIADAGNGRIQRWSDDGFTFWGSPALDPGN